MADPINYYCVQGTITNEQNKPIKGLLIRATNLIPDAPENLLSTPVYTDKTGTYSISYTSKDAIVKGAVIVIRVFDPNGRLLGRAEQQESSSQSTVIDLVVFYKPPVALKQTYKLSGTIKLKNEQVAKHFFVQAFDKDLRSEQLVGEAMVDKTGAYSMTYSSTAIIRSERGMADLFIKVFDPKNKLVGTSDTLFNAPLKAIIDYQIETDEVPPISIFEWIKIAINPLLATLTITALDESSSYQDLSFLSGETGYSKEHIISFVQAHHFEIDSKIDAPFWFVVLQIAFYEKKAFSNLEEQRQQIKQQLNQLDEPTIRKAFRTAFKKNEIDLVSETVLQQWLQLFEDYLTNVQIALKDDFTINVLQEVGIIDTQKQAKFAKLWYQHKTFSADLLQALNEDTTFDAAEIQNIQTSYELSGFTNGNFELIKAIKSNFGVNAPKDIRLLAKKSKEDWVGLVQNIRQDQPFQLPSKLGLSSKQEATLTGVNGTTLYQQFSKAYPTMAFSGALDRAIANKDSISLKAPSKFKLIIDNNPDFEFLTSSIDELATKDQLLREDQDLTIEFKALQRVFKLSPNFEATNILLEDKLHSAHSIYRMGESEFVQKYKGQPGFSKEKAQITWKKAEATYAATISIIAELKATENAGQIAALKTDNSALESFPNWKNLFKGGDICECKHCRSVYSPAAYFADLLMFLKDRKSKGISIKNTLLDRRPDLGYLELNCENANVTIPYIDVVNEVLEAVVAEGKNDQELVGLTTIDGLDLEQDIITVTAAIQAKNLLLGTNIYLARIGNTDQWVLHSDLISYLLKKKETPNYFAEILRNTKAKADQLRANPQYVNPFAYATLKTAKFPLELPFDLFGEEAKASFNKVKVNHWELMQTFKGNAAPNNASDGDIAAIYWGIAVDNNAAIDEKRIVLEADLVNQFEYWGATDNVSLLNELKTVQTFLLITKISYNQLLTLLDLEFINPSGTIKIIHLDSSCDTSQKEIQTLDIATLDKIHRFLRLWRKLGWKMWEVDFVLQHIHIGNGSLDENFLINLMYLIELKNELGKQVNIQAVCSLFGHINTRTLFTALHEKRTNALYQDLFLNKKLIHPLNQAFNLTSVDAVSNTEKMALHKATIQAALRLKETELDVFLNLAKASDGSLYIPNGVDGDLILSHLSFLYRHSFLAKSLRIKATDWALLLKINGIDLEAFTNPKVAYEFIKNIQTIQSSPFSLDELNYLLTADLDAKSASKEAIASRFLTTLRASLQGIKKEFDPNQFKYLQEVPASDTAQLSDLIVFLLQKLNKDDEAIAYILSILENSATTTIEIQSLPPDFEFPNGITDAIKINYSNATKIIRFTGLMTNAERNILLNDPSLVTVTGIADYQTAIQELYLQPQLALKFFEPIFSVPLAYLPLSIDFGTQLSPELAAKIQFNSIEAQLEFKGILSSIEKAELDALSLDENYLSAVDNLYTQPQVGLFDSSELWITPADLDFTIESFYPIHLAAAINKLLIYIKEKEAKNNIIQSISEQFGVAQNMIKRLIYHYKIIGPETIIEHLKDTFGSSSGVVNYANFKNSIDTYYWLHRVSFFIQKWALSFDRLDWLINNHVPTQTINFANLPIDNNNNIVSIDHFLRTEHILLLNSRFTAREINLLTIIENVHLGNYNTISDFAAELETLTKWDALEIEAWINAVDLSYPNDYLLAKNWLRLTRAIKLLDQLNAGISTVLNYATASIDQTSSQSLKQLLHSKYGSETWLTISTEIQDVLRSQKRDALAAYILAGSKPLDAPSGKWENTNDLYAYYLLDIEMSPCMLTSRLVQGSGSIQLFVQRCFMGLEPEIIIKSDGDDGDSAWHWWKWMRKYRIWEANRKVFLYPENWIEPELRQDKSSFFKDLENELLQNEANQINVEQAYLNYLDKLNEVARLEVAAFYHEDDGDLTIMHVFGRTANANPHVYYYRQYDYRSWTPWEKIELDITGNHLIPMVVNKRLYIYWPEFREEPDDEMNDSISIPSEGDVDAPLPKTYKRTQLRLAGSEYRNKKWTAKKISSDFFESSVYTGRFDTASIEFYPINKSDTNGVVGIKFKGSMQGAFELFGCAGIPIKSSISGNFNHLLKPDQSTVRNLDYVENSTRTDTPQNDFSLKPKNNAYQLQPLLSVLNKTPNLFQTYFPWNLSYMDKLINVLEKIYPAIYDNSNIVGSWLPFSYADRRKTFIAFPMLEFNRTTTSTISNAPNTGTLFNGLSTVYYPDIKTSFKDFLETVEGAIRTAFEDMDLSGLTPAQKNQWAAFFSDKLNIEQPNSITDEALIELFIQFMKTIAKGYSGLISLALFRQRKYHFKNFYHPFICDFIKLVYNPNQGIDALMSRETQLKNSGFSFGKKYVPTASVYGGNNYPKEVVDFSPQGSYSSYNWELFYHIPLMIANNLSNNQRFEEAMNWYHYIFNPIGVEGTLPNGDDATAPQKYWITKPFFLTTNKEYANQRIDNILKMLAGDNTVEGFSNSLKADLEAQVNDWRYHPFEPHRIAQYRNVAYQKTTFMKYLDNLVAWGDHLFRQDSMESINEAVQLYILAAELLGPRPKVIPPVVAPLTETFNELENSFDDFSNALIQVENYIPVMPEDNLDGNAITPIPTLYFCIPQNDKLLSYWDTIADRLYKIRNCMNIEGVVRQLSLFEPEIDPSALVKAVAGGLDISSALADLNSPLPYYRFNVLLQKANEVCNDVKSLGSALLTALEKKDVEALSLLRQEQEYKLLDAIKLVKELQIEEVKNNLRGLKETRKIIEIRRDYYRDIEKINSEEQLNIDKLTKVHNIQEGIQGATLAASVISLIPDINLGISGFGGSPLGTFKIGGINLGQAGKLAADVLSFIALMNTNDATMASIKGAQERRWDDWKLQERIAEQELIQLEEQIKATKIKIKTAEQELENQNLQLKNAREVSNFMTSKYTNKELYQWMKGQVAQVYFQSYQLAYDLAKKAERCYCFELGISSSNFIKFGYWDNLKKGLLSGEKLQYDLRRLENAYLEQDRRELELTKHFSLAMINPLALIKLRETGKCFFSLFEELFDLDYPGHYFRRIKSVSISLPCIAGPYTTIACSLRLLNNHIRIQTGIADGYVHNSEDGVWTNDSRFVQNNISLKAIATSSAQNDSGVFELNFRDERYLPFEGAGVISDWTIDLFNDMNNADFGKSLRQFDYSTISDAIIHIRYTAREAGGLLKESAIANLRAYYGNNDQRNSSAQLINLKHDFSSEWYQFMNPSIPENGNILSFKLMKHLFPFRDQLHTIKINSIYLIARCSEEDDYEITLNVLPEDNNTIVLTTSSSYGNLHYAIRDTSNDNIMVDFSAEMNWALTMKSSLDNNLLPNEVEDFYLILNYEWID